MARGSTAFGITAVETSLTPIHQHQRLGIALVAQARGRREIGALAGFGSRLVSARCAVGSGAGEVAGQLVVRLFF